MNRYWKRMQKYRPGLFYYLMLGRAGYGNSKSNQSSTMPVSARYTEKGK